MKTIFGHSVFLNKEQRYALTKPNTCIEVLGSTLITEIEENPETKEIFCKYKLTNQIEYPRIISKTKDGFWINLDTSKYKNLLDLKDGGCKELQFNQRSKSLDSEELHTVNISDMSKLEESILFVNFSKTDFR